MLVSIDPCGDSPLGGGEGRGVGAGTGTGVGAGVGTGVGVGGGAGGGAGGGGPGTGFGAGVGAGTIGCSVRNAAPIIGAASVLITPESGAPVSPCGSPVSTMKPNSKSLFSTISLHIACHQAVKVVLLMGAVGTEEGVGTGTGVGVGLGVGVGTGAETNCGRMN